MTAADAKAAYMRRVEIVKGRLKVDVRSVAAELLQPDGKTRSKARWSVPSPFRDRGELSIRVTGPKAGQWIDFGGTDKGDMLNLIMAIKGCDFKAAVAWAEDRFGLRHMTPEQQEATAKQVAKRQAADDAEIEAKRARDIRAACHMFGKAVTDIQGTVVEWYLMARGIDLRALPNRDTRWLRYLPTARYWMLPGRPEMPAMIAGMVDGAGVMKACHLTFLKADGSGKADVKCKSLCGKNACAAKGCQNSPKLMWPETKGLVIRLNAGKAEVGPLMLCEGIEDGLSIAMGDPDLRVWAAASLSNLANVPDHACVSSFVVAQDNDWGKPQAAAGFKKGLDHLRSYNKPVVPIAADESKGFKDFNNQLMEKV